MTFESILWALNQPVSGTQKIILVGLAFHANRSNQSWPGVDRLADYAQVNRRNTQQALRVLVSEKYIFRDINSGGSPGMPQHTRPNLYELNIQENPALDGKKGTDVGIDTPCRQGHHGPAGSDTLPPSAATPELPMEPAVEPLINNIRKQAPALSKPIDVDEAIWDDWLSIRKRKRTPPLTASLLGDIEHEARIACCSLNDALKICCKHNWAKFEAAWLVPKSTHKSVALVESFHERDARARRDRWEQLTGLMHPKNRGITTQNHTKLVASINNLELL